MSEKMDKLLAEITPEKTLDVYEERMSNVLNRFPFPAGPLNDREAFEVEIARLEHRFMFSARATPPNLEADEIPFHRSHGLSRLLDCFGPDGDRLAFEMARTGIDGGFRAVAKAMADNAAHQFATAIIGCRVYDYWDSLTVDERVAATYEYSNRIRYMLHQGLIPSIYTQPQAALGRYPHLIRRFRQASTAPG